MSSQGTTIAPRIWSCNWNWCPDTFRDSRDLRKHLHETHYNNILHVKKRDWDTYLRSTEGRSGATDSLLAAIPDPTQPTQSLSQDLMKLDEPPRRSASGSMPPRPSMSGSVRHRSPLPTTPPPVPPLPCTNRRTSAEIRVENPHPRANFNAFPSPSEERRSSSPSSPQLSVSDAKRRRMSFASYRAQSSPMSTPSVASVPPSPSLTNMVADAINRTGQLNATSPAARPASQGQSRKPDSRVATVLPLPRRMGSGLSPTTDQPYPSQPVPTSPLHPQSQSGMSPTKALSANSPGAGSVGSAEAVEEVLTQNVFSSASSHPPPSSDASSSTSSPIRKHVQPQTKLEPLPDIKPIIITDAAGPAQELPYPHSSNPSSPAEPPAPPVRSPPLPRRQRARSKTPAQPPAPTTRTLRSRSRSNASVPLAAAQSKSLPLPRTGSRAGSRTAADGDVQASAPVTGKGQRATSKPRSTGKRAGSAGPSTTAGARKGTRANVNANTDGLAPIDEQPDTTSQPAATQPHSQRPLAFRSGTLQLPRLQQLHSHAQAHSRLSQAQAQAPTAALAAGRFGEDEGLDVKVKRELLDTEPLLGQSQSRSQSQSQSESQDGGAWTGFELNPMELLTQKPFASQTQGWGSSQ